MNTQLKYVGAKADGETAFSRETGITWFQGTVADVASNIAVKMLQHPDVFARADDDNAKSYAPSPAPAAPAGSPAPADGNAEVILLGSDELPAMVGIADQKVQLGTIVRSAFARSELDADAWNGLPGDVREKLLADEIDALAKEAANPPEFVIEVEGVKTVLDAMEVDELKALAAKLDVKHHHAAGARKVCLALVEAFPLKK